MAVVEKSWLLSSDEAYKVIAPVVVELFDEKMTDPRVDENVAEKLGFVDWEVVDKEGQIQTKLGITAAPIVGEFDTFKIDNEKYGNKVSYEVERTHIGNGMSSKTKLWLERAAQAQAIPDDLLKDLKSAMSKMEEQAYRIAILENEYYTKVLTEGFKTVTASFGPGSAVYDGKALFATDHIIADTGATYSNIVADDGNAANYGALTFAHLKKAVKMLREMKDGLGIRMKRPASGIYDLVVSPELEETALNILSDSNGFSPYTFAGADAGNSNYGNVFMRDGFKVRLVVLETLNQPDSLGNTIGSETMWFVINKEGANFRKALRKLKFGDISIKMFEDEDTRATFITAEKFFGAQALYPEIIVGSKGTGAI